MSPGRISTLAEMSPPLSKSLRRTEYSLLPSVPFAGSDGRTITVAPHGSGLATGVGDILLRADRMADGEHFVAQQSLIGKYKGEAKIHLGGLPIDRLVYLVADARGRLTFLYQAPAIFPFSSIRNDERMMPKYFLPYIDFSPHTP